MVRKPQAVPPKLLRAYAAFEMSGRAGGDGSREKEILPGNGCIGTENIKGLVQIDNSFESLHKSQDKSRVSRPGLVL